MRIILYPYKMYSRTARLLQLELLKRGIRCLRVWQNGNYHPHPDDFIINLGNSNHPKWYSEPLYILNQIIVPNKLNQFNLLETRGVNIPEYTSNKEIAQAWNTTVVVRHIVDGSGGRGIEIVERGIELPDAPLYTKYVKKSKEYRVHVFDGKVIDLQEKRKKRAWNHPRNTQIRNTNNGYIFCRKDVNAHESIAPLAIKAVSAIYLDFGAVDIIWNNHLQQAFVLEVNSCPGLAPKTVSLYADAISDYITN